MLIPSSVAMFARTRAAGWATLLLFCVAVGAYVTGSVWAYEARLLDPLVNATRGLADAALLCGLAALAVIVGGILLGIGGLRPADVGLRARKLPVAAAVTLALWLLVQLAELLVALLRTGNVTLHPEWTSRGSWIVGALVGQLFGNALFEEIAYRGFLLPQVYLMLAAAGGRSSRAGLVAALLISQSVFALAHIPIRLHQGTGMNALPANLLATVLIGLFFCWVYLRTENLLLAVGVHALLNKPTPLLECAVSPQVVLFVLATLMLLSWPRLARGRTRGPTTVPSTP